ncbi:hypothetical protein CDAR_105051 [Caerostris darwini]|uniref:Uncharacterized protein n=1 Tax=Caerostris darwini TaxID=1538125 RepID=A0AAV4V539_9ARAC|nr:hypothetical protein CDAR_105051 [Caerostris darwini]
MSEELSIKNGIIAMPWARGLASADGRGLVMEMRLCSKTSRPYKRCHRRTVGVAGNSSLLVANSGCVHFLSPNSSDLRCKLR